MYVPRIVGLGCGFFAVGAVFLERGAPALAWALLAANAFLWPHLAYLLSRTSADPRRAERRNLVADSAAGGVWIAAMGFNLLPSVLLAAMLAMDKLSAGGPRLLARSAFAQAVACVVAWLALGAPFAPATGMTQVIGCLPLLIAYPIAVGLATYRLSRRVKEQNRLLAELSRTDLLTGLLNRGHWEASAALEFRRRVRTGRPLSLLMLDVDHFKSINDRHGHPAGDEVLRGVAAILRASLREHDIAGRYGGEEFVVALPDTDLAGAVTIGERIRRCIETGLPEACGDIRCTASIGVAEADRATPDPAEWIRRADRALYRAKALGRNMVVRHGIGSGDQLYAVPRTADLYAVPGTPRPGAVRSRAVG